MRAPRSARRSIVLTTEAVLLGAVLTVLTVIGALYVLSSFGRISAPAMDDTVVSASYCGGLLYVEDSGPHAAVITSILSPSGSVASNVTFPYVLQSGSYIIVNTGGSYSYVTILGNNFVPVHVENGCLG